MDTLPTIDLRVPIELPGYFPDMCGFGIPVGMALRHVVETIGLSIPGDTLELSLTITDDIGMRIINHRHRGLDEPTDVLSFPFFEPGTIPVQLEPEGPPVLLGDIVLSIETLKRQADARGIPFMERFSECLVHGILHILGYAHDEPDGREKMENIEDRLVPEIYSIFNEPDMFNE